MITDSIQNKQVRAARTKLDPSTSTLIAEAVTLTRPGSIYDSAAQTKVMAAGDALNAIAQDRALTDEETRVVAIADRLRIYWPESPTVEIPKSLTDALAAAQAANAPFAQARDEAKRRWCDQVATYHRTLRAADGQAAKRLEQEWKDAESAAKPTLRKVAAAERAINAYRLRE
jgi:hypothetical protein